MLADRFPTMTMAKVTQSPDRTIDLVVSFCFVYFGPYLHMRLHECEYAVPSPILGTFCFSDYLDSIKL